MGRRTTALGDGPIALAGRALGPSVSSMTAYPLHGSDAWENVRFDEALREYLRLEFGGDGSAWLIDPEPEPDRPVSERRRSPDGWRVRLGSWFHRGARHPSE